MHLNHSNRHRFLIIALSGLLLTLWFFSAMPALAEREQPALGHRLNPLKQPFIAPDFKLQDLDENFHPMDQYRGKVILLNFWATWCPPCRREMPSMERLHQNMKDEAFVVLAINQMESIDHVFAYTGQLAVDPTFPILFDSDSKVSASYKARALPTTYLIDKKGMVRFRAVGGREFDHPEVEAQIRALLNE